MPTKLFFCALLFAFNALSQSISEIREQKIDFLKIAKGDYKLEEKFYPMVNEEVDSVDIEMLAPIAGMNVLMSKNDSTDKSISVGEVYDEMLEVRKTIALEYPKMKDIFTEFRVWLTKLADPANWEEDKKLLKEIIDDEEKYQFLETQIPRFASKELTYREVLIEIKTDELRQPLQPE